MAADVAGYSRLIGADEEGTLAQLKAFRKTLVDPTIAKYRGRIVKTTGDGMLVEFASAVDAARCAVEVQRDMASENTEIPRAKRIEFRIGIHLGDIIIDDNDIFGDGVNIAARLESIAVPGGISISRAVHDQVRDRIDVCFDNKGEIALKNIARPVQVFAVSDAKESKTTVLPESKPALALPDKPSIAVLPFSNMSGDPEQDYFADGMVEDIITALSHLKALFVIARNSSFTYKGRAVDVKQVGRELGVRYVLEGSVRKAANRVRITGQLVDTATGAHLWAERFDGGLSDIFDLQDQVTESVVGAIAPAVEKAEIERAKRQPTESLDAYALYLRGLARLYQFNRLANDEALHLFNRAIELDSDFASAYGRAAYCYVYAKANGYFTNTPNEIAKMTRFAQRAVELGKDDAIALATSGYALMYVACDLWEGATLIDRALALNSNLAEAWSNGGWAKNWLGEPEAAIERFARAMRLSPVDPTAGRMRSGTAYAHFLLGHYDEAASWAAKALQDNPELQPALRQAAASHAMAGRADQAHKAMARLRQLNPTLRISNLKDVLGPYQHAEDFARYADGLRRAGLPD
ncbi:adenylate/guanylate cyclase domain-containing protein [Bradyrhizobium sp. AUGA SZCCT0177]|nr:adenylate/guanylate cyclase domain-containing protein [Bradyrhizobium sp. AUGA SZCCT0177]